MSAERKMGGRVLFPLDKLVLALVVLYLLIPLFAALAFGLSDGSKLSFGPFAQMLGDPDFGKTLLLTLLLAFCSMLLSVILVTPTAYWVHLRLPQARPLLEFFSLVPFAVPVIVMALGMYEVYSGKPNPLIDILSFGLVPLMSGQLYLIPFEQLLVSAYVVISLPLAYRSIDNSFRAVNITVLTEAAESLGSGWWRTFMTIILPNVWPGVINGALLTFATAMGEFTVANLFNIFTFPLYLTTVSRSDAHRAVLLSILSFLFTMIISLAIIFLARRRRGGMGDVEVATTL